MDNRRARTSGLDRCSRDLLRGDRNALAARDGVANARDGAGDEDLPVHCTHPDRSR
jgi:hypothetical protein